MPLQSGGPLGFANTADSSMSSRISEAPIAAASWNITFMALKGVSR
jgi:hypothetical protein